MWPVSTKCQSRLPPPPARTTVAVPLLARRTVGLSRKRDDCRRVFTTSKGLVTIAPHIPPRLHELRVSTGEGKTISQQRTLQRLSASMTLQEHIFLTWRRMSKLQRPFSRSIKDRTRRRMRNGERGRNLGRMTECRQFLIPKLFPLT